MPWDPRFTNVFAKRLRFEAPKTEIPRCLDNNRNNSRALVGMVCRGSAGDFPVRRSGRFLDVSGAKSVGTVEVFVFLRLAP